MLTYAFMKLLEARPGSYDRQMSLVSRGRVRALKEEVAALVHEGHRVLEIGCGTGELASLLIARGATVVGLDASAAMLAVARSRIEREELTDLQLLELGVEGLDTLPADTFDVVLSTLVFSELSDEERRWTLHHAFRLLRPGGTIVIADEVRPRRTSTRLLQGLLRAPLVALSYLVATDVSRPLRQLAEELVAAGFALDEERRRDGDTFAVVIGQRKGGEA